MNTNDLYLEYARVIKMCEGTKLEDTPWVCSQFEVDGTWFNFEKHPQFDVLTPKNTRFALAVLEGKPVFVGDVIYDKGDGQQLKIISIDEDGDMVAKNQAHKDISMHFHPDDFTWTPPTPKRTFTLNGGALSGAQ